MTDRQAHFSPCRQWRYRLDIRWKPGPALAMIMLNPSTADEIRNDPTVERQERRARRMGYGALFVANAFAWRSTDPAGLYRATDPVGAENDVAIAAIARKAEMVVCGWGTHCEKVLPGRSDAILRLIAEAGKIPHHLKLTRCGQPGHPLYISYETLPQPWLTETA